MYRAHYTQYILFHFCQRSCWSHYWIPDHYPQVCLFESTCFRRLINLWWGMLLKNYQALVNTLPLLFLVQQPRMGSWVYITSSANCNLDKLIAKFLLTRLNLDKNHSIYQMMGLFWLVSIRVWTILSICTNFLFSGHTFTIICFQYNLPSNYYNSAGRGSNK